MANFSQSMRLLASKLCKELGNACVLTKVTAGAYDPLTGKTSETHITFPTFSAQSSKYNETFGNDGQNTGLDAFRSESVVVPWLGIGEKIDSTWLYDGANILTVAETTTQDEIIIFTITVGEKK